MPNGLKLVDRPTHLGLTYARTTHLVTFHDALESLHLYVYHSIHFFWGDPVYMTVVNEKKHVEKLVHLVTVCQDAFSLPQLAQVILAALLP